MDANLKGSLFVRNLYTLLLVLLQIPYTYILYKIATHFLNTLDWSIQGNYLIFLLPLAWILLIRIAFSTPKAIKSQLDGYLKLDKTTDVWTMMGGTALDRLNKAFSTVCRKADYYPQVTFYLYPRLIKGIDKAKECNIAVSRHRGEIKLLISEKTLDYIPDATLEAILAHELSHLLLDDHKMVFVNYIAGIPSNTFTLFLIWTFAWINLWYLVPAVIIVGIANTFIRNQPLHNIEFTADYFATRLGYGAGLIEGFTYLQDRYKEIIPKDSVARLGMVNHPPFSSRIAKIKEIASE